MKKCLSLILVFLLLTGCADAPRSEPVTTPAADSEVSANPAESTPPADLEVSANPDIPVSPIESVYFADARMLVDEIEQTHPAIKLGEVSDEYYAAREEYLRVAESVSDKSEFISATQRYVATLGDGHMSMSLLYDDFFLNIDWTYEQGALYMQQGEVSAIGGVPVAEVFAVIDTHNAAENEAARALNHRILSRHRAILEAAGCELDKKSIAVTVKTDIGEDTYEIRFGNKRESFYAIAGYENSFFVAKHKFIGDVFYVDLNSFTQGRAVTRAATAMRKAMESGTTEFIIDVRGNGGGNSMVGNELLEALDIDVPQYGIYAVSSPLSRATGSIGDEDYSIAPQSDTAKPNESIRLVVLTDVLTYSSATMLGVWVQDGGLGIVIGQESSNAPNCYGNMLHLTLPHSGVTLSISYKKFLRPDVNAAPDTLMPDIAVPVGEDILQTALDYLAD